MLSALQQPRCVPPASSRQCCRGQPRRPAPPQAQRGSDGDSMGLTLPGLCSSMGACSLEQLSAVVDVPMPSTEQRKRLVARLAERSPMLETQALAAALQADQQQRQQQPDDAVWTLGSASASGDVWCMLQLALHCSQAAAATITSSRRHQLSMTSLKLLKQAAAAVHAAAADWDVWLRGGVSAALGSFVALCSSGGGLGEAAAALEEVSRLVTDAASEEGGAELWALLDVLQRQEEHLSLERAAGLL